MKSLEHIRIKKAIARIGDYNIYIEILDVFVKQLNTLPSELAKNISEQNFIEVKRLAHSLKSNFATIGAESCANIAAQIEQSSSAKGDDLNALFLLLQEEILKLQQEALHILSHKEAYSC